MSEQKDLNKFPDISDKLNAPKKVSVFEKQRQEAESKRLREEAETRKALRDFQDSFADEDDEDDSLSRIAGGRGYSGDAPTGPRGGSGNQVSGGFGGPRHFTQLERSRNVGPGSLGPPPNLKRKRELEDKEVRRVPGLRDEGRPPAFGRSGSGQDDGRRTFVSLGDDDDDEDASNRRRSPEPIVKKPTMLLQSLPINTSKDAIKKLVSASLRVEDVSIVKSSGSDAKSQRTTSALVTVTADTPISEVDGTVSALQGQYLGLGCYLKITRHVSSSGGFGSISNNNLPGVVDNHPFGAKQAIVHPSSGSLRNAPPPNSYGNHPPPTSYAPTGPMQTQRMPGMVQVAVLPPRDIKQLKLINKTAESLIMYGAEFEALLMSRPDVQRDEKWAWLYDSTSQGSTYYRWLVRELYSGSSRADDVDGTYTGVSGPGIDSLFDSGPIWHAPSERPKYEHITDFEDFVEDDEYVSSEDESGDEGERKQYYSGHAAPPPEDPENSTRIRYLNPYRRAKLTHLLARLPENIAQLRMGDVARVTNFVVNNAGQGAEEIVDMLLTNIDHPYRYTVQYSGSADSSEEDNADLIDSSKRDSSPAKLIGLYLISDSIQASSTSGVRDAWKYRSLFEQALTSRRTFEHLGRLEKEHNWGRMKAEQWKRKIGAIISLWGSRSVFPGEAHESFQKSFFEPPLTEEEKKIKEENEAKEREEEAKKRWRSAEEGARERKEEQDKLEKEKRESARRKIEEIKLRAKMQAEQQSQQKDVGTHEQQRTQNQAVTQGIESPASRAARRNRPTAADLNDAPPEAEKLPVPQAASTFAPAAAPMPGMKIGFSLSLGAGASSGSKDATSTSTPARAPIPKPAGTEAKGQNGPRKVDMFGDSDEE